MKVVTVVLVVLVAGALGSEPYFNDYYESNVWDVNELYDRLAQLANMDRPLDSSLQYPDYEQQAWQEENIPLEERQAGQPDTRDDESLQHSAISDGFQYISGGAGEGKQHLKPDGEQENTQEVKSDDVLPFYCHPPNPCPKGKTAEKDGCHELIKDTADAQQQWILKMQSRGMCTCDEEHMFNCLNSNEQQDENDYSNQDELDEVLNRLLDDGQENPYMKQASKREYLVAKKRPSIRRRRRSTDPIEEALNAMQAAEAKRNPYLDDKAINMVAKKG